MPNRTRTVMKIQLAAMLTMLIDHIGAIFFPDDLVYRYIGRIAFPLYAYGIVLGYLYTSDRKRYVSRLFWLALLSQLPFMLAFDTVALNAVFTLLAALLTLLALDRADSFAGKAGILAAALFVTMAVPMDYGWYGVALVCLYRYLSGLPLVLGHLLLNLVYCLPFWDFIQMFSLLPTLALALFPQLSRPGKRLVPPWLWRSFYPAHLAILSAAALAVG